MAQSCKKVEIAPTYKALNGISGHIYGIRNRISWHICGVKNGISRQNYCQKHGISGFFSLLNEDFIVIL